MTVFIGFCLIGTGSRIKSLLEKTPTSVEKLQERHYNISEKELEQYSKEYNYKKSMLKIAEADLRRAELDAEETKSHILKQQHATQLWQCSALSNVGNTKEKKPITNIIQTTSKDRRSDGEKPGFDNKKQLFKIAQETERHQDVKTTENKKPCFTQKSRLEQLYDTKKQKIEQFEQVVRRKKDILEKTPTSVEKLQERHYNISEKELEQYSKEYHYKESALKIAEADLRRAELDAEETKSHLLK